MLADTNEAFAGLTYATHFDKSRVGRFPGFDLSPCQI
jgi:hypothetical protein